MITVSMDEYELDDAIRRIKRARAIAVCAMNAAQDPICDNSDDIALALDVVDTMLHSVISELDFKIENNV